MLTTFKPAWWLKNRHLQTIFPVFFRRKVKISLLREKFILSDGDFLFLDWTSNKFEDRPILIFLHGLSGSSNSPYIRGMMRASMKHGFRSVCMNFRSVIDDEHKTSLKKGYHAGETQDLTEVLTNLLTKISINTPIFIVGYSLGGNVLLKWLAENSSQSRIKAAVAISVPFNLAQTANQLNTGFARLYQWWLLKSLKKTMVKRFLSHKKHLNSITTFWEFDDKITAPMHGFLNVHDYYSKSSSQQYLNQIKTRILIIQSADDPFFSKHALPNPLELPPQINLEILPNGGHVGFVEGYVPFFPQFYLERRIMNYLLNELNHSTMVFQSSIC